MTEFSPIPVEFVVGNIDETLHSKINEIDSVDFAFIDANHRKRPTMHYFNVLKEKCHNNSILVFDDIHWSPEMEETWAEIIKDSAISVSVDFFHVGVVFFNPNLSKEHFVLKY